MTRTRYDIVLNMYDDSRRLLRDGYITPSEFDAIKAMKKRCAKTRSQMNKNRDFLSDYVNQVCYGSL